MPISLTMPSPDNAELCDAFLHAKKALFIAAHPDDIEFHCAGLVHMLCTNGVSVTFAVFTRGGKGRSGASKTRLESMRTIDQLAAAGILCGIDIHASGPLDRTSREHEDHLRDVVAQHGIEVVFYDYPDGNLPGCVDAVADDLRKLIARERPEITFCWDPDYIYNPHPDHQAIADAACLAGEGRKVCYYGTREPNIWVGFDDDVLRIKLRSLKAHRTETPWYYFDLLLKRRLLGKLRGEGAKIGSKYAEVFRMLR